MSVLRCAICEENRDVLSSTVQEILKILGTSVKGSCPLFAKPVCCNCQSTQKEFEFFQRDVQLKINSDEFGNYVIAHKSIDSNFYNPLAIINSVKKSLDSATDIQTDEFNHAFIKGCRLACKCGHKKFNEN